MTQASEATPASTHRFDPVMIELVRNELEALQEEMEIVIQATARSPMAKRGDSTVKLCDGRGRGIGLGSQSMADSLVYDIARRFLSSPLAAVATAGDVFITNDPYDAGSHLPDVFVIMPVVSDRGLLALAIAFSHHTDIGGRFPGGLSGLCQEIYEEGLRIPLTHYAHHGHVEQNVLNLILANVRSVDDFEGDLNAKIAACRRGQAGLIALWEKYGQEAFDQCSEFLNRESFAAVVRGIERIPEGSY